MEAGGFKSDLHRGVLTGEMPVVVCLSLGWRDISDGSEQPLVAEPGHPFEGCQLHRFARWPGSAMNHLGLVQPVDGLGQSVVVTHPFRVTRFVYPKTDFVPSAKECVFRRQGQIHSGIAETSVKALNASAAPPSARPRQRKHD